MSLTMDGNAKDLKAMDDKVVLAFTTRSVKEMVQDFDKSGKSIEVEQSKIVHRALIHDLGPHYGGTLKKGDWVLFDGDGVISVDLPDLENEGQIRQFGVAPASNIWGLYIED